MSVVAPRSSEPIPGYHIVQRLGAGGYGEVWTAQAPGDLVKAIKFVYGLMDEDRATRELKALNRIKGVRHPFLLSLERIEVVNGQLVIVTELADGSLKDRFEEFKKQGLPGIPRDELISHIRDAADALDYMSDQHSLQHLDVKPENLLLLGGRIKVADFGLVKDIQEHTASMMGGLTPVYAPPEVFEGRPSRRSDQYSLAIVFQEMLTGVLPFPGRTAAQLAAQHLNAKPRLTALPADDQPIIAKALAKKPADRYSHCRELVDALQEVGRKAQVRATAPPAPEAPPTDARGTMATQAGTRTPEQMLAGLDAMQLAVTGVLGQPTQPPAGRAAPGASGNTLSPDQAAAIRATCAAAGGQAPPLASLETPEQLFDVQTSPADLQASLLQPTLFVGLGGVGGKILRRLRRRLNDRLAEADRCLLPMLLLDSDARDISAAAHSDDSGQLRPDETLAMPLRRSQDYKNDSRKLLEWLSRRWLYNIPRSQQTEGLRPLGRLALADHSEAVLARLKAAIGKLLERTQASGQAPRVVICGSLCGGSASGMTTDIVMAVRQVLDDLHTDDRQTNSAEVFAVLSYANHRNPQQQELGAANALATLTELAQFHRQGAYFPGDPSCGLRERPAGAPGLDAAYVVHAGTEAGTEQLQAATDKIAEFLLLDAITPAGHLLRTARQDGSAAPGLKLRSFGLYQLGFAHDQLVDEAINHLCREVIGHWNGPTNKPDAKKSLRWLGSSSSSSPSPSSSLASLEQLDTRCAEQARNLWLDVEPLMQAVTQLAAAELGGDPDGFFQKLLGQPAAAPPLARWLAAADDLFGRRQEEASITPQPGELATALDERIGPKIAEVGAALRLWIERLLDEPTARVAGAKRAAKWFQAHLKALVDKLAETRNRLQREAIALQQALDPRQLNQNPKTKTPRKSPQELAGLFLQYCRLRLYELAAQRAGQVVHALQSHAVAEHDALVDLSRELDHLVCQFPLDDSVGTSTCTTSVELSAMRDIVAEQLQAREDAQSREIDEQLTQTILNIPGGLRAAITAGGEPRDRLLAALRAAARQAVLTTLGSIDLASLLLANPSADSPLRRCLTDAQPWLQRCGGRRRLICVIPQPLAEQYSPATLAAQLGPGIFRQLPGVVPDATSDLVLLYELGDISLPHAAANLIDFRPDLIDAASRLHARSDLTWTPLVS